MTQAISIKINLSFGRLIFKKSNIQEAKICLYIDLFKKKDILQNVNSYLYKNMIINNIIYI